MTYASTIPAPGSRLQSVRYTLVRLMLIVGMLPILMLCTTEAQAQTGSTRVDRQIEQNRRAEALRRAEIMRRNQQEINEIRQSSSDYSRRSHDRSTERVGDALRDETRLYDEENDTVYRVDTRTWDDNREEIERSGMREVDSSDDDDNE